MYYLFLWMYSFFLFIISMKLLFMNINIIIEWDVINMNSINFSMSMIIDWMSLLFMSFVLLISSMVMFYSKSYMKSDLNMMRFTMLILLFVSSMIMLIISFNMFFILLGWDGLGLISFLLVIYYQNYKSLNAGMLTILMNRMGDIGILMTIAWMMNYAKISYMYIEFLSNFNLLNLIMLMLILAAMTKSAQIPFSSWLPAAMAAPTPVSSLVHSSTLVTAGIYLMIRFNFLLMNYYLNKILLYLSVMTMFMAALSANYEYDLKKIIALSTLSQLGLMMSILSISLYKLAFFHLLMHALFKALLFLCSGMMIHNFKNFQDIRSMGMIFKLMPMFSICYNISIFILCGIPFLSGFYSKDLILEFFSMNSMNFFIYTIIFISMSLTVAYSTRLIMYSMMKNLNFLNLFQFFDEDYIMLKSMYIMLFLSIFMGSIMNWFIFSIPLFIFLIIMKKILIFFMMIMGMFLGISIYMMNFKKKWMNLYMNFIMSKMWFLSYLSVKINFYPMFFSNLLIKNLEFGWLELMMNMIYKKFKFLMIFNQYILLNMIKLYLFIFLFWINFLMMIMI
uniref:NADH-ubiquinone oxidoreductase chain 5 n=1 Tax=Micropterix calthella TaxID=41027 RepID=A0A076EBA4_9NEOP|nr:NADH dehydrogenase subunit 5 [Micropterix calthella]